VDGDVTKANAVNDEVPRLISETIQMDRAVDILKVLLVVFCFAWLLSDESRVVDAADAVVEIRFGLACCQE
jgi:hypothetical protein